MSHLEIPKDHPRFIVGRVSKKTEFLHGLRDYLLTDHDGFQWIEIDMLDDLAKGDCAAHAAAWWFEKAAMLPIDDPNYHHFKANGFLWLAWGAGAEPNNGGAE